LLIRVVVAMVVVVLVVRILVDLSGLLIVAVLGPWILPYLVVVITGVCLGSTSIAIVSLIVFFEVLRIRILIVMVHTKLALIVSLLTPRIDGLRFEWLCLVHFLLLQKLMLLRSSLHFDLLLYGLGVLLLYEVAIVGAPLLLETSIVMATWSGLGRLARAAMYHYRLHAIGDCVDLRISVETPDQVGLRHGSSTWTTLHQSFTLQVQSHQLSILFLDLLKQSEYLHLQFKFEVVHEVLVVGLLLDGLSQVRSNPVPIA
jgi:hypothetical protein